MYVDVLAKAKQFSEKEREEKFKSLAFTVSGGASISPEQLRNIREVLGLERSMVCIKKSLIIHTARFGLKSPIVPAVFWVILYFYFWHQSQIINEIANRSVGI